MPPDLTPEVLIAEARFALDTGAVHFGETVNYPPDLIASIHDKMERALTILRAAPVAMRERAARWHDLQSDAAMGNLSSDSAGHDYRHAHKTADFHKTCAAAIRALPLDAPAPVDPGHRVAIIAHGLSAATAALLAAQRGVEVRAEPAPVDPVAEARVAAFLQERDDALGTTEYHTDEERAESAKIIVALAQETRHAG